MISRPKARQILTRTFLSAKLPSAKDAAKVQNSRSLANSSDKHILYFSICIFMYPFYIMRVEHKVTFVFFSSLFLWICANFVAQEDTSPPLPIRCCLLPSCHIMFTRQGVIRLRFLTPFKIVLLILVKRLCANEIPRELLSSYIFKLLKFAQVKKYATFPRV